MKFFEEHFTIDHLKKAPHKWFAALCLFPIHAAEMKYKKTYHLKFSHAKKLFFFDMSLLSSIVILIIASITWFTFDPTISGLVSLQITASKDKIKSGDYIEYTISFENKSDISLTNATLTITPPSGFVMSTTTEKITRIDRIEPHSQGQKTISGYFFATPNQETKTIATLTYTQEQNTNIEVKRTTIFGTARNSILETILEISDTIIDKGSTPINITLTNTGNQPIESITIALPNTQEFTLSSSSSQKIAIDTLLPGQTKHIIGELTTRITNTEITNLPIEITPSIVVNNTQIPQETVRQTLTVLHPNMGVYATWSNETSGIPGSTNILNLTLTNNGNTDLVDILVTTELPSDIVDIISAKEKNQGILKKNILTITKDFHPGLAVLQPHRSITIPLFIPIAQIPKGNGTPLNLTLQPEIHAALPNNIETTYNTQTKTASIPIGTTLISEATLRYFTTEGDQIGRGPLPAVVGKQTKYWALINLQNTAGTREQIHLQATLAPSAQWTGKTSVSHGNDVMYNPQTRMISWQITSLAPFEKAGVYIELGITPTQAQQGQSPELLKNITITAVDPHIKQTLTTYLTPLDITLPKDPMGNQKGTKIE